MKELKDRIKELRKALGLSQVKFGERIGSSGGSIANYEVGISTPLKSVVTAICKEFNVSETWLRTGEGEMFNQEVDEITALSKAYPNLSAESLLFIRRFVELPREAQDATWNFLINLVSEMQQKPEKPEEPKRRTIEIPDLDNLTDEEIVKLVRREDRLQKEAGP